MDDQDRVFALIQRVYAAPGTCEGWNVFLAELCTVRDVSVRRLSARVAPHSDADCAFYGELASVIDDVLATVPWPASVASLKAGLRHRAFIRSERELLEALIPHIRRALQLHKRLSDGEALSRELVQLMRNASPALFFVDAGGRVTFLNEMAETLVGRRDGLLIDGRALRATHPGVSERLASLLATVAAGCDATSIGVHGTLALPRSCGGRDLLCQVVPLPNPTGVPFIDRPVALVVVNDPDATRPPSEETLRAAFGLTPAEARLACLVATGASVSAAAARLGWRVQTARTRMKAIFKKTHTHRQSELVRLVIGASAQL